MRWLRRKPVSTAGSRPQDVRVEHADGRIEPVELVYQGTNLAGIHVWEISGTVRLTEGDKLLVGVLPARTLIQTGVS